MTRLHYDWTTDPGGWGANTGPGADRDEDETVRWALRLKSGTTYIAVHHDEVEDRIGRLGLLPYEGTVYSRRPHETKFAWDYSGQSAAWIKEAIASLKPGESGSFRRKNVYRFTDDEIKEMEVIEMTFSNFR